MRFAGKLGLAVLDGAVEGVISGALKAVGTKGLELMIDHDYYIVESIFYSARHQFDYNSLERGVQLSADEAAKLESLRAGMMKTVLPLLGMVRFVASKFPVKAVEAKLTPEWFLEKGNRRFPVLVRAVNKKGDKGRKWLERQVKEIREYSVGRLVWSDREGRMVNISELKAEGVIAKKT